MGATPNGRLACKSISDGTSPSHGCDINGPSSVIRSLTKLDHTRSGGTLLNQRFLPALLKRDEDIVKLGYLIRSYFSLGGHHIQFNIVDTASLKAAQESPEEYKDLLVRMAGYSDYFNDMNEDLQQEIIDRTPTTDTYSAEQTQEEFFYQLPFELMDLIWYGWENDYKPEEVGKVLGKSKEEIENVYKNFERKRLQS